MKKQLITLVCLLCLCPAFAQLDEIYKKRSIPSWFNQDKFGIFVVWGPYSVPGFARKQDYAEWYMRALMEPTRKGREETLDYHKNAFGKDVTYEDFGDMFKAELWDPDYWCDLFERSGAKYVVTTANFHDGFAMWPTKFGKINETENWNAWDRGPKRDIIGELNKAGNKRGLKMGIYYSLYEWYHPLWISDKDKFVTDWLQPKFKEVVTKYKPWHIFFDGEWAMSGEDWKNTELAQWLYNESPVKDRVVTNDRWGSARGIYGDVFESEYGGGLYTPINHPWQEDRGIGNSYGYNRNESIEDYNSREELLQMFSGVIGGGGNFLLCVGPTGDGRIPVIMQERLLQVGEWLKVNGDAIYGTTASPFWPRKFDWGTVSKKTGKLFLHIHNPSLEQLTIPGFKGKIHAAKLLHKKEDQKIKFSSKKNTIRLSWSTLLNDEGVTIIELDVDEGYRVDKTPTQYENGNVEFNIWAMHVHGEKAHQRYLGYWDDLWMHDWTDPSEFLTTEIIINQPGEFEVELLYAAESKTADKTSTEGGKARLNIGGIEQIIEIQSTGGANDIKPVKVQNVTISKSGKHKISLSPIDDGNWNGFNFQGMKMIKYNN